MPVVRPEYGSSLPEMVRPRLARHSRTTRRVLAALAGFVVVMLAAVVIHGSDAGLDDVLVREPTAFTLGHRDSLRKVPLHPGEVLRLETQPGAVPQLFTAKPLTIGAYNGDVTAAMMSIAADRMAAMRAADNTFSYRGEGKGRINFFPAYQFAFQTRKTGRLQFGKVFLIANATDDNPSPHEAIELLLLSNYSSKGTPNIAAVGTSGPLKVPLRSFRFGTKRP